MWPARTVLSGGLVILVACLAFAAPEAIGSSACGAPSTTPPDEGHAPIFLSGDAATLASGLLGEQGIRGGSGSADDPFVISGWHIRAQTGAPAVVIQDVSAFILLEDVLLEASGGDAIRIERSDHVEMRHVAIVGTATVTESTMTAAGLELYRSNLRVVQSNIRADGITVTTAGAPGEYSVTIIGSGFSLVFDEIRGCTGSGFYGLNLLGSADETSSLAFGSSRNATISITDAMSTDLQLRLATDLQFLQSGSGGAVHVTGGGGQFVPGAPRVGDVSFNGPDGDLTITGLRLGNVSFMDTDEASLTLDRAVWEPWSFSIGADATLEVRCVQSDIRFPDGERRFAIDLDPDSCHVTGPDAPAGQPGLAAGPNFAPRDSSVEASGPGFLVAVLLACLAVGSTRKVGT